MPIYPFESYVDQWNFLIDDSGETVVWVCPKCKEQRGPWFTLKEAQKAAGVHRTVEHGGKWEKSSQPPCNVKGCEEQATARGKCSRHINEMRRLEASLKREDVA